jgi:UDP-glucose 4-epimerase
MKCICVIGGTGFIGSYVVRALLNEGRKVVVVGRNEHPTRPLPEGVAYIPGDFGDKYFLRGVLRGVDEIVNLAYASVPKTSYDNPVQDIFDNLPPAVNLFETATRYGVSKVLMLSSGGVVYGHTEQFPINEMAPTSPISPYGITKLAVEKYAHMFHATQGLPVICVRPANAYGESQRPFVGQGFVATAIASVLAGQEITLFGENGTIRDYIHAEDIAAGIVAALNDGVPGEIYNIGSGTGRSNRDILDALTPLATEAGLDIRLSILPMRSFDVPVNILDSSKLHALTGWQPTVTFEDGIRRTWDCFLSQGTN